MKGRLVLLGGLVILALAAAEAVARYAIGLGSPPLSMPHDRIEYMFRPNQDIRRFGNRQLFNEYGMRSAPVADWGDAPRVLVFGDSVLNGGNLTDHDDLATTLASAAAGGAIYGNVSAGSWGIDNILGWIETYGFLDAETAVFVLSSHDLEDPPRYLPLNPLTHPTERPFSALTEALTRYVPRYLPDGMRDLVRGTEPWQGSETSARRQGREGRDALPELVAVLAESRVKACVILHATRSEIEADDAPRLDLLDAEVRRLGVPTLRLADFADEDRIAGMYRDDIHINEVGQRILADAILACEDAARRPLLSGE